MSETKLYTVEEFLDFASAQDERYELVAGVPRMMIGHHTFAHSVVGAQIVYILKQHITPNRLGYVSGADCPFVLQRNPDTVRLPDVAFVRSDRMPGGVSADLRVFEGPDLAVEVISPSNTRAELRRKTVEYFAAGTQEVWIVDVKRRMVMREYRSGEKKTLIETDIIDGGDLIPGFRCAVSFFFQCLARSK